ncbi:MAG: rod-binding protein [Sphingomonadaceae bacterium]
MINGVAPAASAASDPAKAKQLEKLKGAAQQFEAVFLRQMISSMRSASLGDDILGNEASSQFRDLADAETADQMAQRGTLGVAEMLLKQFEPRVTGMPAQTQSVEKAPK